MARGKRMTRPLIIDCFAGGGGASTGIEMALGRSPDYAINHDPVAVAMHAVNHPDSIHLCQNVYQVDPLDHFARAHIGFAWFSPDCKHFSKAKGGAPVQRNIRDLAWIIPGWIERIQRSGGKVDVVAIENVEEFQTWGPLLITDKGLMPDPERKGETFKAWCRKLKQLGGKIELKEMRGCDYGAPTIRKRVFILIRFDGKPIVWPKPTHGDPKSEAVKAGRLKPWLTAGHDVIDWDIVCPSIFDSRAEILARHGLRAVRPLADNTMARVARGIKRYVLDASRPFLVNLTHGARLEDIGDPLRTVTCANRGEKAVVAPSLTRFNAGATGAAMDAPAPTVTANSFHKRPGGAAPLGVVAPVINAYYGEGGGGNDRSADPANPLQTVVTENRHAVVAPVMTYAQQGGSVRSPEDPLHTVTASTKDQNAVVAPHLMTMRNAGKPFQGADEPAHTVTAGGAGLTCVAASLASSRGTTNGRQNNEAKRQETNKPLTSQGDMPKFETVHPTSLPVSDGSSIDQDFGCRFFPAMPAAGFVAQHNNDIRRIGGVNPGRAADEPVSTVTASGAQQGVVAAHVTRQFGASTGHGAGEPTGAVTADVNKTGVVAGALVKYYGTGDGQEAIEPLHTVTTKDRFCLTSAALAAPPFGPEHYARAREVAAFLRAYGFWDEREFVTIDVPTEAGMVTLVMVDIGMRMLIPRELFNAQGFPHGYRIDRDLEGRVFSQSDQVGRAGNSVCPPLAAAIAGANVPHLAEFAEAAE
ncbi:C-5 cytosine-specific DNA methylase [Hoeflea sp. BAL378]|uniref:DNA cytosine methyltransferase n=1 Tax=Hoeflea sp. BAL378 TaxID=1547437 RepID=UPI000513649E|nr:DNA cytosine methyltransferase [Hoeflea sp. BAL378]KGF71168.1 C-5 cytosine-specific DNA methylase [Hoeflea sp. BAL378]